MQQKTVREKVVQILVDIEKDDTYLQLALKKELETLDAKDKGFANELIYGTIKWRLRLDYVLNEFSKIPVKKMKPFVRQLMRMSVYQILFLDKVPASAAINEAVKMMHKRKMSNLSGFVNGVLRNIDRNKLEIIYPNLSVYYSIPEWIITRWIEYYGEETTRAICESLSERARVCIRVNKLKTTKDEVKALLKEEGIQVLEEGFLPESFYIHAPNGIHHSRSFKEGLWTVQDESAMLVGHVLAPEKGDEILDVCSAPGGKTTHLAELMMNEGHIIATDIHEHKIKLIENNAKRLGASIIEGKLQDGTVLNEEWEEKFDKILLDAPCSGLGIIKRKPDIRYAKEEQDIYAINAIQRKLLKNALHYLKKNGILVYSTCTLTQEENQSMVEYALSLGLKLETISFEMPECLKAFIKDKAYIEILPHITQTDGFFMARFRK